MLGAYSAVVVQAAGLPLLSLHAPGDRGLGGSGRAGGVGRHPPPLPPALRHVPRHVGDSRSSCARRSRRSSAASTGASTSCSPGTVDRRRHRVPGLPAGPPRLRRRPPRQSSCFGTAAATPARASKAMVSNPPLAAAVGIDTARLARWTFVFGVVHGRPRRRPARAPRPGRAVHGPRLPALVVLHPRRRRPRHPRRACSSARPQSAGPTPIVSAVFDKTAGYISVLAISIVFLWLRAPWALLAPVTPPLARPPERPPALPSASLRPGPSSSASPSCRSSGGASPPTSSGSTSYTAWSARGSPFAGAGPGFLPLGQALFFGIGAYLAGAAGSGPSGANRGCSLPSFAGACLVPALFAGVVGALVFHRQVGSGPYFSLITLALAMLGFQLANSLGGRDGRLQRDDRDPCASPALDPFEHLYFVILVDARSSLRR